MRGLTDPIPAYTGRMAFRCTIVTPSASVFDAEATYVSIPAWDGQRGVMDGTSPVLTRLGVGPLRVDTDGSAETFLVDRGFAQVDSGTLTIITERAMRPDEITMEEADRTLREANERVLAGGVDQDRAEIEAAQERGRAMKAMASR